jgi:hypothetical protein
MNRPNSVVRMRCSMTGQRFLAHFAWNSGSSRYDLYEVKAEAQEPTGPRAAGPAAAYAASPGPSRNPAPSPMQSGPPALQLPISECNFAGFYCPCCGYGKQHPIKKYEFAKCGTCEELVCGARITLGSIGDVFRCHDGCSGGGILAGCIQSIGASTPPPEPPPPLSAPRQNGIPRTEPQAVPAPQPKAVAAVLPAPQRQELPSPQRRELPGRRRPGLPAPGK